MANTFDKRPIGERTTAKRQGDAPLDLSQLPPLPCFPNLKRILRSWTSTMLLTYLEIHYPAPQDAQGAIRDAPVTLSLDRIAQDLQVNRRTLYTALCVLCSRFLSEDVRSRAARAGREFLNPIHSVNGSIKHYSMTGPSTARPGTVVSFRRNHRLIAQTLLKARITSFSVDLPAFPPQDIIQPIDIGPTPLPHSGVQKSVNSSRIIDILLRDSVLSGDRRSERYPRLRKAVAEGLEGVEVLQIRQSARKRGFIPDAGKAEE